MREIKFRAWNKINNKMMSPDDYDVIDSLFTQIEWQWEWEYYEKSLDISSNGDGVIMQYTGLKDKNGKEIYEGDIVSHPLNGNYKGTVVWAEETARFAIIPPEEYKPNYAMWMTEGLRLNVIGNIYQNPELIKS